MVEVSLIKPTHRAIKSYYRALRAYQGQNVTHEGAVRTAFQSLLADTAKERGWMLIPEQRMKTRGKTIAPDGTLRDQYNLHRGYWEAKDTDDDLDTEISRKISRGYPTSNIVFEDTIRAVLYQNGAECARYDLTSPQPLADLLNAFYSYSQPNIERFDEAVQEFAHRVPELGQALAAIIRAAHANTPSFAAAFNVFFELCRTTLNPNIRRAAVEEMLVQHLLTERLIRKIFDNPEFTRRNVIAAEVEKVIAALVSHSFDRDEFLRSLDRFYSAIEDAAHGLGDYTSKQRFLNTVYEHFFRGYSVKAADAYGIIYTPQEIVEFMCALVVWALGVELGTAIEDPDVYLFDPCTGTGSFVVNLLHRFSRRTLPAAYAERLFANEVMLLPYYVAALNIEHAYYELTHSYETFTGLCFVDTLDLGEGEQVAMSFLTEDNTKRIERQKKAPIRVIVGNPPYNQSQQDENDENRNRKYAFVDARLAETYVKAGTSTLKMQLYDPYVRFFRWATDRLENRSGIICMITNNGFLQGRAFGGFRRHLLQDFSAVYHLDLKGNARTTGVERKRQGGNIFSDKIRAGVGITLLVRKPGSSASQVHYHAVGDSWSADQKIDHLASFSDPSRIPWTLLTPVGDDWFPPANSAQFSSLIPLGTKDAKAAESAGIGAIFKLYSSGVKTNSDAYAYDFDRQSLIHRAKGMIENFNTELDRWRRSDRPKQLDGFLRVDEKVLKWIRNTKRTLLRDQPLKFKESSIRTGLYRPFTKRFYLFDRAFNEDVYRFPHIFPTTESEGENQVICCTIERQVEFSALMANAIPCLHVGGRQGQCFPFYIYSEDGTHRQENITDWALKAFRSRYPSLQIDKWDVFYYVYGLLHHPAYREAHAGNLQRELPRVPFAVHFETIASVGKQLAQLHLNYETRQPYPLQWIESKDRPLSLKINDRMRFSQNRNAVVVNSSLTLGGIPKAAFDYKIGPYSALEWILIEYRMAKDERTGIVSDPNRMPNENYVVDLVGRIVTVSLETTRLASSIAGETLD
jgi:predicted helicase